ncbi:hypothetical protein ACQY1X_01305 [Microcystis protocystis FBCC-A270]|uniref:hypothetical protein n=1 Tax=Microcystis protocystis TaxID=629747 RepID=UPI003D290EF1
MGWKDNLAERLAKLAKEHGKQIVDGVSSLSVDAIVNKIGSIPGAVWDLCNPSDFTDQEKLEVEKLLSKYGLKVSLTNLTDEGKVYLKLNQFLDELSEDERANFLEDLASVLDTF